MSPRLTTLTASTEEMIAGGESKWVEFKQTGRVNLHTKQRDEVIEQQVVKAIARLHERRRRNAPHRRQRLRRDHRHRDRSQDARQEAEHRRVRCLAKPTSSTTSSAQPPPRGRSSGSTTSLLEQSAEPTSLQALTQPLSREARVSPVSTCASTTSPAYSTQPKPSTTYETAGSKACRDPALRPMSRIHQHQARRETTKRNQQRIWQQF